MIFLEEDFKESNFKLVAHDNPVFTKVLTLLGVEPKLWSLGVYWLDLECILTGFH